MIIDGHIGLVIKVLHGDVQAVTALGGELVKSFKAEPDLACNKKSATCVPFLQIL